MQTCENILALRAWPATAVADGPACPPVLLPPVPPVKTQLLAATGLLAGIKASTGPPGTKAAYVDRCHCTPPLACLAGRGLPGLLQALACQAQHSVVLEVPPRYSRPSLSADDGTSTSAMAPRKFQYAGLQTERWPPQHLLFPCATSLSVWWLASLVSFSQCC